MNKLVVLIGIVFVLFKSFHSKKLKQNSTEVELGSGLAYCYFINNDVLYDISPLYDAVTDYHVSAANNGHFYFNFCKFGNTVCNKDKSYAVFTKNKILGNATIDECSLLSGTNYEKTPKWRVLKDGIQDKIVITLPDGDRCDANTALAYYSTTYEITCDNNIAHLTVDNQPVKKCNNVIKMRSIHACPNQTKYSLTKTMRKNADMFGLILLAFGVYYCFFAYKYIYVTRIFTGILITSFIAFFFVLNNLNIGYDSVSFWSVFIMSVVVGALLGWVIVNYPWIVSACLGGFLGYIFTEFLYQAIFAYLTWNPRAVYYIIFCVAFSLGCTLGGIFQKHVFVIACGFIGSYCIMRGIGAIEDNFPNEQQVYDLIEHREWSQIKMMVDYRMYLYLVFSLLLGCVGVYYQYKNYFKDVNDHTFSFTKLE